LSIGAPIPGSQYKSNRTVPIDVTVTRAGTIVNDAEVRITVKNTSDPTVEIFDAVCRESSTPTTPSNLAVFNPNTQTYDCHYELKALTPGTMYGIIATANDEFSTSSNILVK
jgi:hypothetical protein